MRQAFRVFKLQSEDGSRRLWAELGEIGIGETLLAEDIMQLGGEHGQGTFLLVPVNPDAKSRVRQFSIGAS